MNRLAAVLWDLDGTILDTEPLWMAAERELADQHGVEWTEADGLALVGNDLKDSGRWIRERLSSPMSAEEIVDHLVARLAAAVRRDRPWRPGARELVEELAARGVPQALVTMSYASIAEPVADLLPFDTVVTGDVVTRGKPDPEPYLLAAERLGVRAEDCIAIEDSPPGAASAQAAGCFVVAVPHMVDVPPAERRILLPGLGGLDAAALLELWGRA